MPDLFSIQALVCLSLYSCLILIFFAGWLRTKKFKPDLKTPIITVSILIPCKDEAENIPELIDLLNSQQYPGELIEVICIDDHSTDTTSKILSLQAEKQKNYHFVKLPEQKSGKKAALKAGMESATGTLILLTDADSRPGPLWVQTMVSFFTDTGNDLILGPVILEASTGVFNQIQKLEYLSLVASSIGAAGIGCPIMAQGPNMGVRASDYRVFVNNLDNRFESGDDVFLLQAMKNDRKKKIAYVLSTDAIVRSKPAKTLAGFMHQRSRWASKASGYRNPLLLFTTLIVFGANLEILAALAGSLFFMVPFHLTMILLGIKMIADLPLLLAAIRFFRCPSLLIWIIPIQALYPLYVTIAGILSQISPVHWKND